MRHRQTNTRLPGWLWFFLSLPIGLVTVLLMRRKKQALPQHAREPLTTPQVQRYVEPDSIPIEMRSLEVPLEPVLDEPVDALMLAEEIVLSTTFEPETGRAQTVSLAEDGEPVVAETTGMETRARVDDLKRIEGIGPTISKLLRAKGITTFQELAGTSLETLDAILMEANLRRIADPGTWPEQAEYAARGDWSGLEAFTNTLKGGRRVN